jgi:ATP-dependent Lon protease
MYNLRKRTRSNDKDVNAEKEEFGDIPKKTRYLIDSDDYDSDSDFENDDFIDKDLINGKSNKSKYNHIKNIYNSQKISIEKVLENKFNDDDNLWFFENFKRMKEMETTEKFELQDKIKKRYKTLVTLNKNNMYEIVNSKEERDLVKEILESTKSDNIKSILLRKLYSISDDSIEDYQKIVTWIDTILKIPDKVRTTNIDTSKVLYNLYQNLKENLSGMDHVIMEILQAVCTILNDPDRKGYILCLLGPPGVGKTSICNLISKSIGMGFGQIPCGSISDQSRLMGHSSTYVSSQVGDFTKIMINSGQLDNVILLDEMDKLPNNQLMPVLVHVLDKSQNSRFHDAYCPEIDIDLSKNFFVIAVNDINVFDDALKDRLKVIKIKGYDIEEKFEICQKNIIPKIMKRTGINLEITKKTIKEYVKKISPNKSGVRELERFFSDIYEKLLFTKNMNNIKHYPFNQIDYDDIKIIDSRLIRKLLEKN